MNNTGWSQKMDEKFIYGKPGSNRCSHELKERAILNGAVRMDTERPTPHSICLNIGNGRGKWVEPKFIFIKTIKQEFKLLILRLRLLLRSHWSLAFVVIFLFFSFIFLDKSSLLSLWIGLLTSVLFYLVNDVYPRNKRAKYESLKVSEIIKELNELKNLQYVNLGYLVHWAEKSCLDDVDVEQDKAIDGGKAIILQELMNSKRTAKEIKHYDYNLFSYTERKYQTYGEYFIDAHVFLQKKLAELKEIVKPELFPKLYRPINDMVFNLKKSSFHTDDVFGFEPYEYTKRHFQYIEFLECLYEEECAPYLGFTPAPLNVKLSYDKFFIKRAYHPDLNSIPRFDN